MVRFLSKSEEIRTCEGLSFWWQKKGEPLGSPFLYSPSPFFLSLKSPFLPLW